jgi:hypothetical protein
LDANLHGPPIEKVAAALTQCKIPFVVISGYGRAGLPATFQQVPVLAKPIGKHQLRETLTALILQPRSVVP